MERKGRKAAHRDISRVWGPQPTLVALRIDATWRRNYWISLCKKNIEKQPNVPLKPVCYGSRWEEIEKTLQLNKEGQLGEIILWEGGGERNRPYLLHLGGDCFCRDHKTRELMQLRRRQQRKCRWKTKLGFFKPYGVYLDPLYLPNLGDFFLDLICEGLHLRLKRKRKICRHAFTSSIRKFDVVVVQ